MTHLKSTRATVNLLPRSVAVRLAASRNLRRIVIALCLAVGFALNPTSLAVAAPQGQHQNAYEYINWDFVNQAAFWNIDQIVQVPQKAEYSYWALVWKYEGDLKNGGYMGLQTNGQRSDGTSGDTAVFSLWNAIDTRGSCGSFAGEGDGLHCAIAYPINPNNQYRLRVWRLEAVPGGQWWGAWIEDMTSGVDTPIGEIKVADSQTQFDQVQNFSEYWGPQVDCGSVPESNAIFTQPAGNQVAAGVYQYYSTFDNTSVSKGDCTGGTVASIDLGWTQGAEADLGGTLGPGF